MTRDDVLHANQDLIAESIAVLQQQPVSRLTAAVDTTTRSIEVTTSGLDHLDLLVHGHPGSGQPLTRNTSVTLAYPEGAATVELAGYSGGGCGSAGGSRSVPDASHACGDAWRTHRSRC